MIRSYEQHSSDLAVAKHLTKKYLGAEVYRALFKGPKTQDGRYDINRLPKNSYTAYILGDRLSTGKGCTQEDFIKNLRKQFEGSDELQEDADFLAIKDRLYADDGRFLAKQKTRLNGAIPYQLHLEEMQAIIDKQERFYPFLGDNRDLLKKIVSSRIPYYVGPLNNGHDPHAPYKSNAVDASRKFAWSVRKKGMEHVKAYPWNVDEVIDTDLTAERFIRRMTGTCSYLYGEPVLPRHSLLYEEFCVLNELNSAKWCEGGGEPHRFTSDDRADMMEELFKKRKSVPHKAVADWLLRRGEAEHAFVSGTQDEETFKSQLVSYNDFRKILCVKTLEDENCPLKIEEIEEIILWNTVFEDRDILRRKLVEAYGDKLSPSQINKIVKIRYTGWGRLSRKFLTGIKTKTVFGSMSIMDIMRDGDPITGHHAQAMNLMEVLHSDDFGFQGCVDEENEEYFKENNRELTVDDMQGSPALRRSVNQAMRILDELVSIAGKAPACICIESTREEDGDKKGRRTHSRYDSLKNAIRQLKSDAAQYDPELLDDLERSKSNLDNEKLVLYFMQGGKSLYSGNDLDINRLGEYQVDHILPQSYIKDDSFDNKALVLQEENQRKRDSLLLDNSIINSQTRRWKELNRVGLISDKKLRNLTCRSLSERRLTGFVNRQLVETSQVIKFVRQMCEQHYPDTEIISVRASLSHGLREKFGLVKSRVMNDYHHAHDAYLACQVARFMSIRYPKWQNGFDVAVLQKYIKSLSDAFERDKKTPGQSGFVVDSFARTAADEKTGEIIWDAEYEIGRIRKELSYKDCFISRMPEEQTGAFWKETIISPRAKRNPNVPQKVSGKEGYLNPKRYGGFETTLSAYFFIFAALDKKGSRKFFFEGVPVHLANRVAEKPEVLNEWAAHIASQKGCHDAVVLRKRIPLRQKLRIGDSLFSLGGRTGKYNVLRAVVEIGGNLKLADVLNRCEDGEAIITQEEAEFAYEELSREIAKTCPELSRALKLDAFYESFSSISREEQKAVLVNVANSANGVKQNCDLSFLGGSSQAACIRKNIASYLSQITWIDTSVTGIFEKKTTFEDLIHGL